MHMNTQVSRFQINLHDLICSLGGIQFATSVSDSRTSWQYPQGKLTYLRISANIIIRIPLNSLHDQCNRHNIYLLIMIRNFRSFLQSPMAKRRSCYSVTCAEDLLSSVNYSAKTKKWCTGTSRSTHSIAISSAKRRGIFRRIYSGGNTHREIHPWGMF